jgi:ATP-binding protein involved in chromosome partitioning
MQIEYLGSVPIDQRVAKSCDLGESLFENYPDSPAAKAFESILYNITKQLN